MPLSLRPWTFTDPDEIPEAGAAAIFTLEARSPGVPARARFTFQLYESDGYEWSEGGTSVTRTADLGTTWNLYDFPLGLRQREITGARLLLIPVEGVLVDEEDNPTSAVKKSLAKLTVEANLGTTVRAWRQADGVTLEELALQLGISEQELADIEDGERADDVILERIKELVES